MKPTHKFAIALAAGVSLGAVGIEGLGAQSRPPTYFIVDISEITDPEGFQALAAKATPEILAGFGGRYVAAAKTSPPSRALRRSGLSSLRSTLRSMQKPGRK